VGDNARMTTWEELSAAEPGLAAAVRARFEAARHHVLATVRRDGSPRVSGTEVRFHGPDLLLGSMWQSVKARDLQRDGRYALHTNPGDGSMEGGDAKLSGTAAEITDPAELAAFVDAEHPPEPFHLFRLSVDEVVRTSLRDDQQALVIETWRPGAPVRRVERA
jgi:Pyridoxamine 5'-phosphate oxidase